MLDPLTALSLASSVVQFVDFGIKLVTEGCELYEKGSLKQNNEIELITRDLTHLTQSLTDTLPPERIYVTMFDDDRDLHKLASSCKELGDEMLSLLASLKPNQLRSGLKSFRLAVRSMKNKGTIIDMQQRLEKFQKQLVTHLVVILR